MISIRWACQDWATPVNLPLAVNFTDTDPAIGSYGGIVDLVAKSDAPKSLVKTTFLEGLQWRTIFDLFFLDSVVPLSKNNCGADLQVVVTRPSNESDLSGYMAFWGLTPSSQQIRFAADLCTFSTSFRFSSKRIDS